MLSRMLISSVASVVLVLGAISPRQADAQNVTQPLVRILDINVESVVAQGGQLVANAVVTLEVVGRTVTQDVQIPLALDGSPGAVCDILNLAVGPLHLEVLGLVVDLDDCNGGPVTVDITAMPGEGKLLGNLLCAVAGLLDSGIDLGSILNELPAPKVTDLTGAIRDVLNAVLGELLDTGVAGRAAAAQQVGGQHRCDILSLEIPDGLTLDLLGLVLDTSGICLDVYAEEGSGNLLGNLLCNLSHLLDRPANANALQAQVRNILRLLDRLGL